MNATRHRTYQPFPSFYELSEFQAIRRNLNSLGSRLDAEMLKQSSVPWSYYGPAPDIAPRATIENSPRRISSTCDATANSPTHMGKSNRTRNLSIDLWLKILGHCRRHNTVKFQFRVSAAMALAEALAAKALLQTDTDSPPSPKTLTKGVAM